jgi:organic radical activating enzyme
MTYFLIDITNKCNKSCDYCAVKPWLNKPHEFPDKVNASDLMNWLDDKLDKGDVVKLTGGEPTLFPELQNLLGFLKVSRVKVILETNGLHLGEWRKDYGNMIVVLSKHDSSEDYMNERKKHLLPQDLVLDGVPEHIKQKDGEIAPHFVNDEISPLNSHPFDKAFFVTNDGKVKFMPCSEDDGMGTVWDYKPVNFYCCPKCSYMLGAWNLANRLK